MVWNRVKDIFRTGLKGVSQRLYAWFHSAENYAESLETMLLEADFGIEAAQELSQYVAGQNPKDFHQAADVFQARLVTLLTPYAQRFDWQNADAAHPEIVIFLGVNGAGKTTLLGKLAHAWKERRVRCIAADTFRAGASDQLEIWAKRAGADVTQSLHKDPASVVYQGLQDADTHKNGLIFVDTAGRLPNRKALMEELTKIYRVIKKFYGDRPHRITNILVLDGTTGHHMHTQVELFQAALPVTGLVLNKMDGTAGGGMLVALTQRFKLPIYGLGVGEGLEDWCAFDAKNFAAHIMGDGNKDTM
jgi:fused signal recognition particle receptor